MSQDQIAMVVGVGGGLGAALGRRFAAAGMKLALAARGSGAIIFTGATAALRGGAGFINLAVGKFGLRALAQSMARELGPSGVHIAHAVIDGRINGPSHAGMTEEIAAGALLDPNAIAETYYQLHRQDRTAWTQELDLRPAVEKF